MDDDGVVVTDDPQEIMRIIFDQAVRNHEAYLDMRRARLVQMAIEVEVVAEELNAMKKKGFLCRMRN